MARSSVFTDLLKFGTLGLEMGAAVVIGLLIGIYLDRRFNSEPWLTLIFLGFGFTAAVRNLLRALKGGVFKEENR